MIFILKTIAILVTVYRDTCLRQYRTKKTAHIKQFEDRKLFRLLTILDHYIKLIQSLI